MSCEKKKIGGMNEAAWILGIILCSLGVTLCTKAGFGLSMIAAPPHIIFVKLSQISPIFTRGVSEYIWQAILLVFMCIAVKQFKLKYLLSFVTALILGAAIDGWLFLFGGVAVYTSFALRILCFAIGEIIVAFAVAFYFRTSLPHEVCDYLVVEISKKYKFNIDKVKLINDIAMLFISLLLAFFLNRSFDGIGIGTVIITLVNAPLISMAGKVLDRYFTFEPRFKFITENN
ncbi:MAG: hypothetical protein IJO00_00265 [Clostridia bacterium]|nr:hypothetical protein [Clostridia bacterium]